VLMPRPRTRTSVPSGESEHDLQSYRPWRFGAVHRDPRYAAETAREAYRYYYRLRYPLDSDVLGRPRRLSALHERMHLVRGDEVLAWEDVPDGQPNMTVDEFHDVDAKLRENPVAIKALADRGYTDLGLIPPMNFIPMAEETGLIVELGEWVLRTACAEAASWPQHVRLAVNVSPVQLKCQTLALKITGALAASGLAPNRLELEITEAVLIRDDEAALAILHQLRAIGVRIALDDFGTGYSSLSYLKRFPFDKIKIDRCFVNDVAEIDGSSAIVQAVVNIAAARNMTTTAEGVETAAQREMLRSLGCKEMQGHLFSPARPAPEVRRLLGFPAKAAAALA